MTNVQHLCLATPHLISPPHPSNARIYHRQKRMGVCSHRRQSPRDRSRLYRLSRRSPVTLPQQPRRGLETLTLVDIRWYMHIVPGLPEGNSPIQKLRAFLQFRRREGRPLKRLFIRGGYQMCRTRMEFESLRHSETDFEVLSWKPTEPFWGCTCVVRTFHLVFGWS